jgi:hypothetical protein
MKQAVLVMAQQQRQHPAWQLAMQQLLSLGSS